MRHAGGGQPPCHPSRPRVEPEQHRTMDRSRGPPRLQGWDSSPFVKAKRAIKRGSYSQWAWRDLTRGKTRVIPKMALEAPPRFPWRSACCQAPCSQGRRCALPRTPSHSPASGLHGERVPQAPGGNHRADSPPVAKPARKLFQAKVRLQTASPHAPDRRAFRLPTWHRPQRAAEQRRTARHGRGCGPSVAARRTWRGRSGRAARQPCSSDRQHY